jgi:hypothetical protein
MEIAKAATAATNWGAYGTLKGIYECGRPGCGRYFHPDQRAGYLTSGRPSVREPRCGKGHVAAVISVDPDTGERKYGCVMCNVELAAVASAEA